MFKLGINFRLAGERKVACRFAFAQNLNFMPAGDENVSLTSVNFRKTGIELKNIKFSPVMFCALLFKAVGPRYLKKRTTWFSLSNYNLILLYKYDFNIIQEARRIIPP